MVLEDLNMSMRDETGSQQMRVSTVVIFCWESALCSSNISGSQQM